MADFIVALTGGIASGKSTVAARFAELGIAVADADAIAREVVAPGSPGLAAVVARFGRQILTPRGELDRPGLRRIVFADPQARRDLEAIMHPRIRRGLEQRCRDATSAYVVADIPLLAEGGGRGAYPWLDRILVVDVPPDLQMQRLMLRDAIEASLAQSMLGAQAPRELRLAIADDVIDNASSRDGLQRQVDTLHAAYLDHARRRSA